ncbi:hypothetical protein BIW11_02125 [Tropilaelaps mercedesae]|uniref:GSK-3-binding protein-like n=1 Tax=Tropilaelaps mercedesae TaxID=418985 RepID=A0A1V9X2N0_9ACAR|nr:hypothetical protein BIW11_02125 [Tropilaelaps mercedesae]
MVVDMKLKDINDLSGHSPLSVQAVSSGGHSSPHVMDELVSAIRENLKLKTKSPIVSVFSSGRTRCTCGGAALAGGSRASRRVSPYSVPSRENRRPEGVRCVCGASATAGGAVRGSGHSSRGGGLGRNAGQENPYELLQALLRQGTLIQEAVRRLREPQTKAGKKDAVLARTPSSVESCASCDSNPTAAGATSFLGTAACAAT